MLADVEGGERGRKAGLAGERHGFAAVTPRQFLGIEVKPWAKEIAELVLWIGYLQWHFRTHGRTRSRPSRCCTTTATSSAATPCSPGTRRSWSETRRGSRSRAGTAGR